MGKRVLRCLLSLFLSACVVSQGSLSASPSPIPTASSAVQALTPTAPPNYLFPETAATTVNPSSMAISGLTNSASIQWSLPIPNPTLEPDSTVTFASLDMKDANAGWGLDTTWQIVHTADGGSTWLDVTPPNSVYTESNFFALDANYAWAVDRVQIGCGPAGLSWCPGAILWRTSDGGKTWHYSPPLVSDGPEFIPVSVDFTSATRGWLVYEAGQAGVNSVDMGFFLTDDGGDSWTRGVIPQQGGCLFSNILFMSDQEGWIGDNCPRVMGLLPRQDFLNGRSSPVLYETLDGGRTWNVNPVPMPNIFPDRVT